MIPYVSSGHGQIVYLMEYTHLYTQLHRPQLVVHAVYH